MLTKDIIMFYLLKFFVSFTFVSYDSALTSFILISNGFLDVFPDVALLVCYSLLYTYQFII